MSVSCGKRVKGLAVLCFSWTISALLRFLKTKMLFIQHQLARRCFIIKALLKNLAICQMFKC